MTELRFDGRVAVITGAGGGIGRGYALLLAARGASVVVNDLGGAVDGSGGGDSGAAAKVVEEIRAAGGTAVANTDSVSSAEGGRRIVATALDEYGRLDIVINNAGILRDGTFHKMTPESFESVVGVHLLGAFYVSQPAFTHMRGTGYGRIVMTTSAAGLYGNFGQVNYSTAKMGLVGMSKTIALEGARHNIKSNVIAPVALSRMTSGLMSETSAGAFSANDIAPAVGYLAHEDCAISGEILSAYGGHVGRPFVGETKGLTKLGLTIEDVAANIGQILEPEGAIIPANAGESMVRDAD